MEEVNDEDRDVGGRRDEEETEDPMEEEIDMSCVLTCLDMEEEAFYYCAGWLAKNFHNRYAIEELGEVGHPTGRWPVRLGEPARWIAAQSRGNKIGHLVKYMYLNTVHVS